MAIGTATPRDQLDRLIAFVRRAMRYWWLVAIIAVIGGALSATLALESKPKYTSESRLLYNERINSSLLGDRNMVQRTKNLGNKYRQILMARTQMEKVITELGLMKDTVATQGIDMAVQEFRPLVKFRVRGTNMFHISYTSVDPEEAQAVTAMLTDILMTEERRLSQDIALKTKNFLVEQKSKVGAELAERQRALYKFLAEHPEFTETTGGGEASGAGIRAAAEGKSSESVVRDSRNTDPRLLALERQRRRIKARLEAPDPGSRRPQKTQEQREAERAVEAARRKAEAARSALEEKKSQLREAHPEVRRAQKRLREAEAEVRRAEAAVPPDPPKPREIDRAALAEELEKLEGDIAATRSRIRRQKAGEKDREPETIEEKEPEYWVVQLENDYAALKQAVDEARRRVNNLDNSLSSAEIKASQQLDDDGAVLSLIDPPNLPTMPQGKGKKFLMAAGLMVFIMLGTVLALALALVDDRICNAGDLEHLKIAPVMVVIPRGRRRRWLRRG